MLSIKGDLELMTLPELLQWPEMNGKSGTLAISGAGEEKFFYFQEGQLIYFNSRGKNEKLGEQLTAKGLMSQEEFVKALTESKKLHIPFIGYLISENICTRETLQEILTAMVNSAITEVLQWPSGSFEFKEEVPSYILHGPIKLNVTQLLFHSSVAHDEVDASGQRYAEQVLQDLDRRIQSGLVNIPATPELIIKLNNAIRSDSSSLAGISKIITTDQPLVTKLLKVVNSPFFTTGHEVTSLQRAITIMGLSAVKSIAIAHTLSTFSPANAKKVKPILRHCLFAAFLAKQLANKIDIDPDEAFVCGILHDIGKTILIDYLSAADLPESLYLEIIAKNHCRAGYFLALEWQLSEIVQETVLHHHTPDQALRYPQHVLLTYFADRIANGTLSEEDLQQMTAELEIDSETIQPLTENIEAIKEKVGALV
ncbi:MAG: HDOD domain-containing protein [Deltaproteobacteria bacterium]